MAEAGMGGQQGLDQLMQQLQQMGLDPNMIQQLMQSMGQPNQGGNYQPQGGM
jgi:SOS response regulatory protein OraA/RecX